MADEHLCEDCGSPVTRKNNRGPWPRKCASCKAGNDSPVEPGPGPEEESAASLTSVPTHTRTFTISQPALYLDDPHWHEANAALVVKEAVESGLQPTGDCQCTDVQDGEHVVLLTYTVPVANNEI